ncbi:MAG: hypothetical protein ACREDR_26975 [Blastocatellia bacterium]
MGIFDLVFILVFFFTVGSIGRILYLAAKKRGRDAARPAKILAALLVLYFGVLIAISAVTPRKLIPMGEDRCYDDWCIGAENLTVARTIGSGANAATAKGIFYIVTLKVSSRALRITQRAKDAAVVVIDEQDRSYFPSAEGQRAYDAINGVGPAITNKLGPGDSFTTTVIFDIPLNAAQVGLEVQHGFWPGRLIIGESTSFFHKRTLIALSTR